MTDKKCKDCEHRKWLLDRIRMIAESEVRK